MGLSAFNNVKSPENPQIEQIFVAMPVSIVEVQKRQIRLNIKYCILFPEITAHTTNAEYIARTASIKTDANFKTYPKSIKLDFVA